MTLPPPPFLLPLPLFLFPLPPFLLPLQALPSLPVRLRHTRPLRLLHPHTSVCGRRRHICPRRRYQCLPPHPHPHPHTCLHLHLHLHLHLLSALPAAVAATVTSLTWDFKITTSPPFVVASSLSPASSRRPSSSLSLTSLPPPYKDATGMGAAAAATPRRASDMAIHFSRSLFEKVLQEGLLVVNQDDVSMEPRRSI